MSNDPTQFDGAVHDEANVDIGNNRAGERVVRLDLTYTRGTAPSRTTTILTVDGAIALRNHLDGLFAAAGIDDGGSIDGADACPRCGNADHDTLVWAADGEAVRCANCGTTFRP